MPIPSVCNRFVGLVVLALLICSAGLFGQAPGQGKTPSVPPPPRTDASDAAPRVFRLENLNNAQTFADLEQYGLLGPEQRNHRAGTNLVMLALQVTSFGKGDWVMAYGLLGASMLDVGVEERIAYQSLFLDYAFGGNSKMY